LLRQPFTGSADEPALLRSSLIEHCPPRGDLGPNLLRQQITSPTQLGSHLLDHRLPRGDLGMDIAHQIGTRLPNQVDRRGGLALR
jgi:hypothetical protein